MKAVITVIGRDRVGIIASLSRILADYNVNILDISQTIMQDIFSMIMMVDTSKMSSDLAELKEKLDSTGKELDITVTLQHVDIFNSMHRI